MKSHRLLSILVLGTGAVTAHAQSSLTIFGTADLGGRYVKNDGSARRLSLETGGLNTSQFGLRGVEDMGDGLKASFLLLSTMNLDSGSANSTKFWDRRSTVSLSSRYGELRVGHDYVPTYWNNALFDPFGAVGIGDIKNLIRSFQGITVPGPGGGSVAAVSTYLREDNSIGYFLPAQLGGVYGQLMVGAAEGGATNLGRHLGGRIGFASGPVDIAAAYGQTRAALAGQPRYTVWNIGASYDFGILKLMGSYHHEKNEVPAIDVLEKRFLFGAVIPIGHSEIHVSTQRSDADIGPDATQYTLGYVYNLSKRTALYSSVAMIRNKGSITTGGNFALATVASGSSTALPTRGGESKGAEFGLRHFF